MELEDKYKKSVESFNKFLAGLSEDELEKMLSKYDSTIYGGPTLQEMFYPDEPFQGFTVKQVWKALESTARMDILLVHWHQAENYDKAGMFEEIIDNDDFDKIPAEAQTAFSEYYNKAMKTKNQL